MTIFLVVIFWSFRTVPEYEVHENAEDACVAARATGTPTTTFRATITKEGRITNMVPLECHVKVETK